MSTWVKHPELVCPWCHKAGNLHAWEPWPDLADINGNFHSHYCQYGCGKYGRVEGLLKEHEMAIKSAFKRRVENQWDDFMAASQHLSRINLWGPPGIGKTYGAIATRNHDETLIFTLSEDVVAQELQGHYIPSGNHFEWHDGPITTAFRKGYNVVANELGRASSAVKDMFLAVLDNPDVAKMTLPTGEVVVPGNKFKVIATSNTSPEMLDPALADRFEANLLVEGPHPDLIAVIDKAVPGLGAGILDSYQDPDHFVSPRCALAFIKLTQAKVPMESAARIAFGEDADVVMRVAK